MLVAIGWLLVALIAQVCVNFLFAFAVAFQGGFVRSMHGQPWVVAAWVPGLVAAATLQLALLFIAWRRGAAAAGGDSRRGLGIRPLRRPWLLVGLSIAVVPVVTGWTLTMRQLALLPSNSVGLATVTREQALAAQVGLLLVAGIVAPIAEEWFFRGWLWTSLGRDLKPFPVVVMTTGLWLLIHLFDGPSKLLYLLPLAVLLCIARHYCDSVRASITLHLLNNLVFLGVGVLLVAHGR